MITQEFTRTEMDENYDVAIRLGPLLEVGQNSSGLDYYKPTMSQMAYEYEPNAEVTFTFNNRGSQRLMDYISISKFQDRLNQIRERGWSENELSYFASLKNSQDKSVFKQDFLYYLRNNPLPEVNVRYNEDIDDLAIETTGSWTLATFWETIVMSELNESYFEGYMLSNNINPMDVYDEGNKRLTEKISILNEHPDIKFADFGTRRHFSLRWQKHVLERLITECPKNFVGTSNVSLSETLDTAPIGTFAHEMFMVYAGLADARNEDVTASHNKMLRDWYDYYGADLAIALTDTFTSDFFFSDFTPQQAEDWRGARQDSGDPYEFGEKLISFYKESGVDPTTKTVVFSDGLDINTIVKLNEHFKGRINVLFGWGTTLTNDLGIKPLNVVMKATHVKDTLAQVEADTVKLSDTSGKHMGPKELVRLYLEEYFNTHRYN